MNFYIWHCTVDDSTMDIILCIIIISITIFCPLWYISRGLKTKLKLRTNAVTATFHPRGLCGRRYPKQRSHCSVELKPRVAERGWCSSSVIIIIIFQDESACSSSLFNLGPSATLPLVRSGGNIWDRLEQLLVFNNRLRMSLRSLYSAQCERNSLKHKVQYRGFGCHFNSDHTEITPPDKKLRITVYQYES